VVAEGQLGRTKILVGAEADFGQAVNLGRAPSGGLTVGERVGAPQPKAGAQLGRGPGPVAGLAGLPRLPDMLLEDPGIDVLPGNVQRITGIPGYQHIGKPAILERLPDADHVAVQRLDRGPGWPFAPERVDDARA